MVGACWLLCSHGPAEGAGSQDQVVAVGRAHCGRLWEAVGGRLGRTRSDAPMGLIRVRRESRMAPGFLA